MVNEIKGKSRSAYAIRVKNHLESRWSSFFEGWTITNLANGDVLLSNHDVDQAGLHGVLNRIRDLNFTLLSVIKMDDEDPK